MIMYETFLETGNTATFAYFLTWELRDRAVFLIVPALDIISLFMYAETHLAC